MQPETIAGTMLGVAATLTIGAYVYNRLERAREERERNVAQINLYLQRCWRIIDNLPVLYMPGSLRAVMSKLMRNRIELGLKLDAHNPVLDEHQARMEAWEASHSREMTIQSKPNLKPAERKQVSQLLRDVKLVLRNAVTARVINKDEYVEGRVVVDALLLRILVDHLKSNAENSEKLGHAAEATNYMQRARNELANADRALYAEEIADIDGELQRLHRMADPTAERRRETAQGKNVLLEAWEEAEAAGESDHTWHRTAVAQD